MTALVTLVMVGLLIVAAYLYRQRVELRRYRDRLHWVTDKQLATLRVWAQSDPEAARIYDDVLDYRAGKR